MVPLFATILVPAIAAQPRRPVRAFRTMIWSMLLVNVLYGVFLYFVYLQLA